MKKKVILLIYVLFLSYPSLAQDKGSVLIFIKDTVKTIRMPCLKAGHSELYLNKVFNRKLRFNLEIINNSDNKTLLYLLSRDAHPLMEPYFNKLTCASDSIYRALNKDVGFFFGISYSIQDKEGFIVSETGSVQHVPSIMDQSYKTFEAKVQRIKERNQKRLSIVLRRKKQRILNRITIVKSKKVHACVFLKRYFVKPVRRNVYYCFDPKETYYLTFYYTFYLGNEFDSPMLSKYPGSRYSLSKEIEKDIKENIKDPSRIFQGQIISNTVKLIVK